MEKQVRESLQVTLEDWSWMQKLDGDDGAAWAEKFEQDFYTFIDTFEKWFVNLETKPVQLDEAESLKLVVDIQELLPGPLQLNFLTELERIVDGETSEWFD
ncbi:hypothetical protein [Sutcliffiella halmapala]|uniref:hypothetical protein n=1 Tax=Sutcliffiella halmapala TaxID=79882 RepID=UPI000995CAFA|nr:hypothetical protein [Sutcliffiella halmapala]